MTFLVWSGSNLRMEPNNSISSADFLAIVLTALGVILAALAVFLGGMAIFSWRDFDNRVKSHVEGYLNDFVNPSERFEAIKELLEENKRKTKALADAERELENLSKFDEDVV